MSSHTVWHKISVKTHFFVFISSGITYPGINPGAPLGLFSFAHFFLFMAHNLALNYFFSNDELLF